MLVVVAVGAAGLFGTGPGHRLLDDLTGAGSAAAATEQPPRVEQVDVAGPAPGVISSLDGGTGRTSTSELKTGSCYDTTVSEHSDGSFDVTGATERDCSEPHQNEALAVVELEADRGVRYPGADTLMEWLSPTCERAQRRVLGPEPGPDWAFATIHPSPDSWAAGDRQGICEVSLRDGSLLDSPLAGTSSGATE